MKKFLSTLLITFLISCSADKFSENFLTFELRLAESEPDQNLREMIFYKSGQKFFVHDSVFLSNNDLVSAEVIDWQTQPKIKVTLNEEGCKKFAEFTLVNVGKNAAMIVDNRLVSVPRINAQITEGLFLIVGFFDHEEAQKIADGIIAKSQI